MNTKRRLLLLLLVFALNITTYGQTTNLSAQASILQACQFLQQTKPTPVILLSLTDEQKRKDAATLYTKQMAAIQLLAKEKASNTAAYIIPYLDTASPDYHGYILLNMAPPSENTNDTLNSWPALAALTVIPGAANDLSSYALNKENSVDFRFAAFSALRYIDKNECKAVGNSLMKEFSNSEKVKSYVNLVEDGKIPYNGAIFTP